MSIISRHQQSKGPTYARYLDLARSAGLWTQPTPITPKGILITSTTPPSEGLPWAELIRKYLKHNPGRELTAEVATTELALRSLLGRADQVAGYDHDQIHLTDNPEAGQSVLPPPLKAEDQRLTQKNLTKLTASLVQCNSTETDPKSSAERNAANIVIAFGHYLLEDYEQCLEWIRKSDFKFPDTIDNILETYDLTLLVMGLTVKGLTLERQGTSSAAVVEAYNRVTEVYDLCLSRLCLDSMDEFNHELHAWAELAMYRTCTLSRAASPGILSLESHRKYCSRSKYWPPSFRLHKRGVIYKSYIQLLLITYRSNTWKPLSEQPVNQQSQTSVSSSQDRQSISLKLNEVAWRAELMTIARLYSTCLQTTTSFPRAGSINHQMLEFCELLFEGWQLGGSEVESTSSIVEMLYEATRKTFHSQKILRYQIRLLDARRDWEEAEAALDLYLQLHTISRTTTTEDASESSQDIRASGLNEGHLENSKENATSSKALDHETDEEFVETIIYGSRMLIKFLNKPDKASKLLASADEIMRSTKNQEDMNNIRLKSRLARMRGIAAGAQAHRADQESRSALHASYLEHLNTAAEMNPNSFETMYHLAYAQTELRDVDAALVTARAAVELNSNHTEAWHLLCLLTSASRELKLALDIAEVGLVNTEEVDDDEPGMRTPKANSSDPSRDNSLLATLSTPKTRAGTPEKSGVGNSRSTLKLVAEVTTALQNKQSGNDGRGSALPLEGPNSSNQLEANVSTSSTPSASPSSHQSTKLEFPVDKTDKIEANIQLRMTKNVLIEALQGPEVALSDQQNLFAFFAQVYSYNHTQDILQMTQSRTKRATTSSLQIDKSATSTPSSTHRLGHRSSRSKHKKGLQDPKLARSISTRSYISQSLQPHKQRSSPGPDNTVALADGLAKEEEEKKEQHSNSKSIKTLQDLWLMSAATFRRWGKNDECKGAVEEAENLNAESSDLWVQFGLYCLSTSDLDLAIESLMKAIAFDDQHIPAVVHLSRILKEQGSVELAESLLDVLTQTVAWDTPEAWYLLSEIYLTTDRLKRGKECLLFSLSLEETKPIRPLRLCLPYCL